MMRSLALPALLGLVCLLPSAAVAAPLDQPSCEQLRQDLSALDKAGARINFAKGAAWAKANLKPDQIQQVEKLIDAESQFLFRCPQPKRQFDAATEAMMEHGTGSDPDPDATKPPTAADGATPPATPKAKAVKKAAAAPAAETKAATTSDEPVAPKPKAKRAPRPKAEDAYQPEAKKAE